jgi:alcohol dehydrogenase
MSEQIQVARLVATNKPLEVGQADKPKIGPKDVLVRVAACSLVSGPARQSSHPSEPDLPRMRQVPNTKNVFTGGQGLPLQRLPAIVGLDVSGVIEAVGDQVHHLETGQRVYVNPHLTCDSCHHCRRGRRDLCPSGAFATVCPL